MGNFFVRLGVRNQVEHPFLSRRKRTRWHRHNSPAGLILGPKARDILVIAG
jgi:hypothetical protein